MLNQELLDYIKKELEQGKTKEQIEEALLMAGWEIKDVDEALNSFNIQANNEQSGLQPQADGQLSRNQILKKPKGVSSNALKIIGIIVFILLILGAGGFFAFKKYIAPILNQTKNDVLNNDQLLASQNPICNYPVNGESLGQDCRFVKDPAQIRYEKAGECGSTLSYGCDGGEYSKYKSACVGTDYYDYSGDTAVINTFMQNGQCVHSGDSCSAVICENDSRCGGVNQNCVPKQVSNSSVSKNKCFDIDLAGIGGFNPNNFQCTYLKSDQPFTITIKGENARLDIKTPQGDLKFLLRNEGAYMSLIGEMNSDPGNPLYGADWMFFPGSSYCNDMSQMAPGGVSGPNMSSQVDVNEMLRQSRENLECKTFMAQDNFFHHPGKVVDMGNLICEQVISAPPIKIIGGIDPLTGLRSQCQEWSQHEIINP